MKINLTDIRKDWKKQIKLMIVLIFIIIALYFELNILISKLNVDSIDVTTENIYSISDKSKELLKDISDEVKIELVNFNDYSQTSTIADIVDLVNQYSDINNNITVEEITDEDVSDYSIVITYNDEQEEISFDDLYSYKFSTETYAYEEIDLCEEKVTNAILDLVNNKSSIYFFMTHSAYTSAYFSTITSNLYNVNFINSDDTEQIPEECECLIIPTMIEDISENEKIALINYINDGGNILLLQESKSLITAEMPNFQEVISQYGFEISEGVVLESDQEKMIKNKPGYMLVNYNIDEENSGNMCIIEPGIVSFSNEETLNDLGITYNVIAYANETAFVRTDTTLSDSTMTDSDSKIENAILAAEITKKISDDKESKLIVYSNSIFATDQSLAINDILTNNTEKVPAICLDDNETVMVSSINHLLNENNTILIRKSHYQSIPTLQFLQNSTLVEMIFAFPMAIIIIGYIVWRIRKNKK